MAREKRIDFQKAKDDNTILKGMVRECRKIKDSNGSEKNELFVSCGEIGVIIPENEVDLFPFQKAIRHLVGEEITFCILEVFDKDVIYGSMKKAREIKTAPIIKRLKNGDVLEGTITALTERGAYIDVNGVHGFMNNYDFADDGTEIRDRYKKFETIKVKFEKYTPRGYIIFYPEAKIEGKSVISEDKIEIGSFYLGKVTKVFVDKSFVLIAPKIAVLCPPAKNIFNLRINDMVSVKIKKKFYNEQGKLRLRGEIDRIIPKQKND